MSRKRKAGNIDESKSKRRASAGAGSSNASNASAQILSIIEEISRQTGLPKDAASSIYGKIINRCSLFNGSEKFRDCYITPDPKRHCDAKTDCVTTRELLDGLLQEIPTQFETKTGPFEVSSIKKIIVNDASSSRFVLWEKSRGWINRIHDPNWVIGSVVIEYIAASSIIDSMLGIGQTFQPLDSDWPIGSLSSRDYYPGDLEREGSFTLRFNFF